MLDGVGGNLEVEQRQQESKVSEKLVRKAGMTAGPTTPTDDPLRAALGRGEI